jgi:hypothetical protein
LRSIFNSVGAAS